ncbi:MAG: ribonuclease J [Anaerolineae bacterium]|nr:ribonuclease J [Anaerolineae bacterium]
MSLPLKWLPMGGLGEVGKNMMMFEYDQNIIIIDAGLMFPASDMHGIDYVIPDYQYAKDRANQVKAIIITHGHEDHIGAIEHVVTDFPNVPVYATPLTCGLIEVKLRSAKLLDKVTLNSVPTNGSFEAGPFKVEFFRMCHSIPDNVGVGITTPAGLVVHSGDFKLDQTPVDGKPSDFAKIAELGNRGVLALFSDSTNAETPGFTPSEREIEHALELVFRDAPGRIIVATFASLLSRVQQVVNICDIYGRKLALAGTSMIDNVKMAQKMGYLKIPDGMLVRLEDAAKMKPSDVAIMATGSQGEPSSVLTRMARGRHQTLNVEVGDTIVMSANVIPGNEESIFRTVNRLFQAGANVIYPAIARVHVSGHACQEEQKLLINLIRPKYFVPVHGELRMLKAHSRLARDLNVPSSNIFVVENGTPIEFTDDGARQHERLKGGWVFVDGRRVGDIGPVVIRDREMLSREGFILQVIRRNADGGLSEDPEIITRGWVHMKDSQEFILQLAESVGKTLADISAAVGDDVVKNRATEALSRLVSQETKRKPLIITVIA